MEEIIMEEYADLKDPLINGVFVPDGADISYTNQYVQNLPSFAQYLQSLRDVMNPGYLNPTDSSYKFDSSVMNLSLPQLLEQEGLKFRISRGYSSGAKTKQGRTSNHAKGDSSNPGAYDIIPADGDFNKFKQQIYSNPRIKSWLVGHRWGILEETTQDVLSQTGGTGKHFHFGPDPAAIQHSSRYMSYSNIPQSSSPSLSKTRTKNGGYTLATAGWNVSRPFKNISSYRVNLNARVTVTKEDLWGKDSGASQTVHNSSIIGSQTRLGSKLARRHNNPCNISPRKGDFGYIGSSSAADGQKHGGYRSVVEGLASTMKLYLDRYNNKSIRTINNGYQGYLQAARKQYSEQDWKALENLRLLWITHVSDSLGISPLVKLNLNDKETMFSLIAAVAKQESTSTISRRDLEAAWSLLGRS